MATNFLEQLVAEWYEYKGYFIRRNIHVGKRPSGGYECELDVVAFKPDTNHLVHIEPSTDASSWDARELRYLKKFQAGRKYIPDLFPGLVSEGTQIEQIALLVFSSRQSRQTLGGGKVLHISDLLQEIIQHFSSFPMIKRQVPEQFSILRTLQFAAEYRDHLWSKQP